MQKVLHIIFCLSYLLTFTPLSQAQNTWFRFYDFYPEAVGQDPYFAKTYKGFVYFELFAQYDSPPTTRSRIIKLDSSGNVVWNSPIKYPPGSYTNNYVLFGHDLQVAKDGSVYYCTRDITLDDAKPQFLVNKFDSNGNLLWWKMYPGDGGGVSSTYRGLTLANDSLGIYLAGRNDGASKYLLYKIDSSGAIVWKNTFPVPVTGNNGFGLSLPIVVMPDNSIIGAYDNNYISDRIDYVFRTDSTGNPVQFRVSPFWGELPRDMKLHPNGHAVYLSEEEISHIIGVYPGTRVSMLTPDLDTVWTYYFYDVELPCVAFGQGTSNLSIHPDGRILGSVFGAPTCQTLFCLSAEGKLLWQRDISLREVYPFGPDIANYLGSSHGAEWTSDGGIISYGYLYGGTPFYEARPYVMKLDSSGCLESGCQITIVTDVEDGPAALPVEECFVLAPNPSDGRMVLDVAAGCSLPAPDRLELTDALGSVMWEHKGTILWPLVINPGGRLPGGLYVLRGWSKGQQVVLKKVLIR